MPRLSKTVLLCCLWREERQRPPTPGRAGTKSRLAIKLSQGAIASLDHHKEKPFWYPEAYQVTLAGATLAGPLRGARAPSPYHGGGLRAPFSLAVGVLVWRTKP